MIYKNIIDKINCIEKNGNPIIIGINGVDGSGKTYFSNDLKKYLENETNKKVILVSVDDFHNPKEIRYKKGKDSAEGFYYDSYNYNELITKLLKPFCNGNGKYIKKLFDLEKDEFIELEYFNVEENSILILEGIFLFREELEKYFDLKIFLDVRFEVSLTRNINREKDIIHIGDKDKIIDKYNKRYMPGQKLYFNDANPKENSDIIINNNDYNNPFIIKIN